MAKHKGDILIGQRMAEEVVRLFPTYNSAAIAFGTDRKIFRYWQLGGTPSGFCLARLHYLGGDVIYVLTGKRERKYKNEC